MKRKLPVALAVTAAVLVNLLAYTSAFAGTFNRDKCMVIHYAWSQPDIHAIGTDMALYPYVYVLFRTDGTLDVVGSGYPPGDYDKAGKNLALDLYNPDNSPAAMYDGRKKKKSETCYVNDNKACWQGTNTATSALAGDGVWEGRLVGMSNCQ